MEQKNQSFQYTYSAKEQEEIQSIRNKYQAPEETDMERLRRLDASVTKKAGVSALTVGILGMLLLGIGMSFVMTDLIGLFGAYRQVGTVLSVAVGALGIALVCLAYPLYNRVIKKERKKIAPEILRLTDELLK